MADRIGEFEVIFILLLYSWRNLVGGEKMSNKIVDEKKADNKKSKALTPSQAPKDIIRSLHDPKDAAVKAKSVGHPQKKD